jgi:DNA repair exonuclease SbcCD ATPase subunit
MQLKVLRRILILFLDADEYKRSLAISEAFNFLLDKIKVSEEKLKEGINSEMKYTESIKNLKSELNEKIKITELNLEEFEQKEFILTNKIDALNSINKSLENKVKQFESEIKNFKNIQTERDNEFEKIILEYKENFEKLGREFQILQNNSSRKEKEFLDTEKKLNNEINSLKEKEIFLNKKLKEFEVLIYKQNLENQNLRDGLRNFNSKTAVESLADTLQSLSTTKIDVENELKTIDNTICKYLPTIKSEVNYGSENFLTINSNLSHDEDDMHNNIKQTIEPSLPTNRFRNIEK